MEASYLYIALRAKSWQGNGKLEVWDTVVSWMRENPTHVSLM